MKSGRWSQLLLALTTMLGPGRGNGLEIRVRAPTRCRVRLAAQGGALVIEARVLDDRGRAVGGTNLQFAAGARRHRGTADTSGRLVWRVRGERLSPVRLSFPGDERFAGCTTRRSFDPAKRFPHLRLRGSRELRDGDPSDFVAHCDAPEVSLRASFWRGRAWQEIARGRPDSAGSWRFRLGLLEPGPGILQVEALADDRHNAARADLPVTVVIPTKMELATQSEVPLSEDVRWRGSLGSPRGPVVGALISVFVGGFLVATLRTDPRGRFSGRVSAKVLGPGLHLLRAAFSPSRPGLGASASSGTRVAVLPSTPLRGFAPLLAGLFGLLALVGLWSLRRRPRPPRPKRKTETIPQRPQPPPSLRRALRRLVPSRVLEGGVWNGYARCPVPGARIQAGPEETLCDSDGRFRVGPLSAGTVSVSASAPNLAPEVQSVPLPVREDLWIELWPWREKILRSYGEVAARLVPGPPLGQRTPSEVLRDADSLPDAQRRALAELTALVLDTCYSPRVADEAAWRSASHLITRLEAAAPRRP